MFDMVFMLRRIEDHRLAYEPVSPADLFEISRRRRCPFHIHNPERTSTGTKINRVAGAYWGSFSNGL
jgi:hypothetical protein